MTKNSLNSSHLYNQWIEIGEGADGVSPKPQGNDRQGEVKREKSITAAPRPVKNLSTTIVLHVKAVLNYTKGYCQREDVRKLASEIEQKAINSTAEMDLTPDEAVAEYAIESGKIDILEQMLNESMQAAGKTVRPTRKTTADLLAKEEERQSV
ncbi:hypothetical protein A3D88_00965 [Candidatus Peribacteria bacterium RIFCSPHIGHO2_02_FULL_52_16]|nr:MAG: hypothetical protein A2706_05610 [Candidatus Peribacteria bacterium RIFCSPHIGHO2_01_FULL_51_35]OGJ61237.1 MAG: hypothetical protein A3D88_00965 [Candidatus Peribacteria bacterium RIFCSPHIGHO2_02_FULL_52_16]